MTEKDFIEKVNKQRGFIDAVDAWRLIHFFTEKWGVMYYDKLSIEDELCLMWMKLQEDKSTNKKKCSKCKEYKLLDDFNKDKNKRDGRCNYCKVCIVYYNKKRNDKKKYVIN